MGLKYRKGDVISEFLYADVYKGENIYVEMAKYFKQKINNGKNTVLILKNTIYGLIHISRNFWEYLAANLEACGLDQSILDPRLFFRDRVIFIVYMDDIIF